LGETDDTMRHPAHGSRGQSQAIDDAHDKCAPNDDVAVSRDGSKTLKHVAIINPNLIMLC